MDPSERDGDPNIRAAEVVLPCDELGPCLTFFERLGFRLESIGPADDPSTALLGGHGLRIRLERGHGTSSRRRICAWSAATRPRSPPTAS